MVRYRSELLRAACAVSMLGSLLGCGSNDEIAAIEYVCETVAPEAAGGAGSSACGKDDPNLPSEPICLRRCVRR